MKQTLTFFAILLLAMAIPHSAKAYSFSAVAPTGQMLYYNIVTGGVEVTSQNYSSPYYTTYPTGALTIPSSVTYGGATYTVTSIGWYAFSDCSGLTSVTIPDGVTSIGYEAFAGCSGLTSVTIPNSVTSIGSSAFSVCSGLTSLTIGSGVTSIGEGAFYGCSGLTSVTIGSGVTSIGDYAFFYCSGLTSVTIPDGVTTIGEGAFCYCYGLTSVTIPDGVTSIGSSAFAGVRHIEYHGSATGSPWGAFSMNGVTEGDFVYSDNTKHYLLAYVGAGGAVTIPSTVDTIGQSAFWNCSGLTSVSIPDGVTAIGNYAFQDCSGLTSVTIGSGVTSIGGYAFAGCIGLDTVFMRPETAPSLGHNCFYNNATGRVFMIPCGSYVSYYNGWSEYRYYLREPVVDLSISVATSNPYYGSASVMPIRGNNVYCDSTTIVYATANGHCVFDHWSNGNTANPDTLHLTSDSVVTAVFIPNQYALTVSSNDTTLGSVVGSGTYEYLDTVSISATAIEHYHFVRWDDGNTDNPREYVIVGDKTLTAIFVIDTHNVSVTVNDIARGMVQSTGTDFVYGTPCTVTATAYTGYTFAGWSNGVNANPYTFAVLSDVELTALFVAEGEEVYTVTVVSANPTMGIASGGGQALDGGTVTIRAAANPGYHFLRWNDNNTDSVRTIEVHGNVTYTAYFEANDVGIIDVDAINAKVYTSLGHIVVEGTEGNTVWLYDVNGRILATKQDEYSPLYFDVPASGTYLIKIGNHPARRVVVIK